MADQFRALCAELVELSAPVDSISQLTERLQKLNELAERARALLAQQPVSPPYKLPEPEGPSDEELRDLWSWSSGQDQGPWPTQYHCFARAVLARFGRPAAEPVPETGEVAELVLMLRHAGDALRLHGVSGTASACDRAAELLERPTPQPVAVSERLPGPEDCDADGRCWLWERDCGYSGCKWALVDRAWSLSQTDEDVSVYTHWLPSSALSLPTPEATND